MLPPATTPEMPQLCFRVRCWGVRMLRKCIAALLTLLMVGFGQPGVANDLNVSMTLSPNSWQGRLHSNGSLDFTFSGAATRAYSNCQSLLPSLRNRLKVDAEVAGQSTTLELRFDGALVSVNSSSITCRVSYSGFDYQAQRLLPVKLSLSVDGQVRHSKDYVYQSYMMRVPTPSILSPTRGQEISGQFSILLDEPSDLAPYLGLSVEVCKEACTNANGRIVLDSLNDLTKTRTRPKQLFDGGSIWWVSDREIRVNAAKLKGLHTFKINRMYATNCWLGFFSQDSCSMSIWSGTSFTSEVAVNIASSPLNDPAKRWNVGDFAQLSGSEVKVSRTSTCEGDYGFIKCAVGVESAPRIAGTIGLSMFWAADNQKPKLHKKFTLDVGNDFEDFYFNPKVSDSVKKLRFYFVWDGETLTKTKPQEIPVQKAQPVNVWKISVSAPRNIRWGQTMSVSVSSNPALNGSCDYFIGTNLMASSRLTKGKSSARFEALFQGAPGSAKTFSVTATCKSGSRSGAGYAWVNGFR